MASGGSGLPAQQCPFLEPRDEGPQCLAMGIPRRIPTEQRVRYCYTANHVYCPRFRFGGGRALSAAVDAPDGHIPPVPDHAGVAGAEPAAPDAADTAEHPTPPVEVVPAGDAQTAADEPAPTAADRPTDGAAAPSPAAPEVGDGTEQPLSVPRSPRSATTVAQPVLRPLQGSGPRAGRRVVRPEPVRHALITPRRAAVAGVAVLLLVLAGAAGMLAGRESGGREAPAPSPSPGLVVSGTPTAQPSPSTVAVASTPTATPEMATQPATAPSHTPATPTAAPSPVAPTATVAPTTPPSTIPPSTPMPLAPPVPGRVYVVARGDTLAAIAAAAGVQPDLLAVGNGLAEPGQLSPGQTLYIPDAGGHLPDGAPVAGVRHVVPGDTLDDIARQFGLSVDELVVANGIADGRHIEVGWLLVAPWPGTVQIPPPPTAPPVVYPNPADIPGQPYTVVSGDTVFSIGKRFGVTVDAILSANGLPSAYIQAGWTLLIPTT